MISYEVCMEIKILFQQGKSIREIARLLDLSCNTVREALRKEGKP
jgi:DNA-binding CsgD family transcriptional regulator